MAIDFKKIVSVFSAAIMLGLFSACFGGTSDKKVESAAAGYAGVREDDERNLSAYDYTVFNTCAEDDYGRISFTVDGRKKDKDRYVGMFYFVNLGLCEGIDGIHNVTELIKEYGEEIFDSDNPLSPNNKCHYWGQPVWGYYHSQDTWVMRKQVEMFTMSGIDFLVFDCSNAITYDKVTSLLLPILLEYQSQGWRVPKVAWHLYGGNNTAFDESNLRQVYENFYVAHPEWDSLWFKPEGKPLVITMRETHERLKKSGSESDRKLADYFHYRYGWWPTNETHYNMEKDELGWPWMDYSYPQKVYTDQMSVSVAQHYPAVRFSDANGSRGRGWNYLSNKNEKESFPLNLNFENQWKAVAENDDKLKYVFVTGWNEWGAVKLYHPELTSTHNGYMMCDTYNDEFSRDIEPTYEESLKDNNYIQLIRKVREYYGEDAKHYKYPAKNIDISDAKNDEQWENSATFKDFTGECVRRYWLGFDSVSFYEDDSNRNDIDTINVAKDDEYLYFRISALNDITTYESGDTSWMNVWISTGNSSAKNYMGYDYVVNRNGHKNGKTDIMKFNGLNFEKCAEADIVVDGKFMILKIAMKDLNLGGNNYEINFKVTDNVQNDLDVLSFYNSGDSAPIGKLNYKFGY